MKRHCCLVARCSHLASIVAAPNGTILLNAAGATFPYPIYSKWFDVYHTAHPNVQINYQSIGSGGGIRQIHRHRRFRRLRRPHDRRAAGASEVQNPALPDGARRGCAHLQCPGRTGN